MLRVRKHHDNYSKKLQVLQFCRFIKKHFNTLPQKQIEICPPVLNIVLLQCVVHFLLIC